MSEKKEDNTKLKQKINKILPEIKSARKNHKIALEKLEKGAVSNGKPLDNGKIKEVLETEKKLIKNLELVLEEIESKK